MALTHRRACVPGLATAIAVVAIVGAAAPARADVDIESDQVKQGIAAYNDLDYARAIATLKKALATETLTRDEKMVTFQTLGFAHVALGKTDEAITDFENLLRTEPQFELDRTISPRVRSVFEQARARVATGKGAEPAGGSGLPTVTPEVTPSRAVKEGHAVSIAAAYPGGLANHVELFYRTRGDNVFGKLTAPVDPAGRFGVTIPGMSVKAPAVEYYLVVLDDSGASVAAAGSLGQPLAVDVVGLKKPVYKKGWFWGVVAGAAVVAGGVATAVALSTRSTITSTTPATVTIQPQ